MFRTCSYECKAVSPDQFLAVWTRRDETRRFLLFNNKRRFRRVVGLVFHFSEPAAVSLCCCNSHVHMVLCQLIHKRNCCEVNIFVSRIRVDDLTFRIDDQLTATHCISFEAREWNNGASFIFQSCSMNTISERMTVFIISYFHFCKAQLSVSAGHVEQNQRTRLHKSTCCIC